MPSARGTVVVVQPFASVKLGKSIFCSATGTALNSSFVPPNVAVILTPGKLVEPQVTHTFKVIDLPSAETCAAAELIVRTPDAEHVPVGVVRVTTGDVSCEQPGRRKLAVMRYTTDKGIFQRRIVGSIFSIVLVILHNALSRVNAERGQGCTSVNGLIR